MGFELVEIQPPLLKFTFEPGKQSSCLIQLTNKTEHFVGFKVKTTSPKKYVVKPNVGLITPKGTSDFTVIMLAQTVAPPDLLCKDKFLVISTVVPFGLTKENITSELFVKDESKHIYENKLKVVLVPPTNTTAESSVSPPTNGVQKEDFLKDASPQDDIRPTETEILTPQKVIKDRIISESERAQEEMQFTKDAEPRATEDRDGVTMSKSVDYGEIQKLDEVKLSNGVVDLKLTKEVEELSLKLNNLESKLHKMEQTAKELSEEKNRILIEKQMIHQELALARKKTVIRRVYKGYPLLYLCVVGISGLTFGYLMHQ